ncbi:conserved hypothetical protein [uncultured Desulfovibrio sp.]|uniref:Uncharacterized protein n=1 Tax=uncultured Desulfovibrio sp. TaxID=167968 RepID=A0A212K0N3_9BACT|nr:conserved hypothetical protein [uncultured Desulfovibrio sp.]
MLVLRRHQTPRRPALPMGSSQAGRMARAERIKLLGTLGAVLGTALATIGHAGRIKGTAHDVVTDTGQVFYTTAADDDHGVFLKVVAFAGDVGRNFDTVGQAHTGDLTQSRVRLFRGGGVNAGANATALRASLQGGGLLALHHGLPLDADKLVNRGHYFPPYGILRSKKSFLNDRT